MRAGGGEHGRRQPPASLLVLLRHEPLQRHVHAPQGHIVLWVIYAEHQAMSGTGRGAPVYARACSTTQRLPIEAS